MCNECECVSISRSIAGAAAFPFTMPRLASLLTRALSDAPTLSARQWRIVTSYITSGAIKVTPAIAYMTRRQDLHTMIPDCGCFCSLCETLSELDGDIDEFQRIYKAHLLRRAPSWLLAVQALEAALRGCEPTEDESDDIVIYLRSTHCAITKEIADMIKHHRLHESDNCLCRICMCMHAYAEETKASLTT